jgi:hypothetical protein
VYVRAPTFCFLSALVYLKKEEEEEKKIIKDFFFCFIQWVLGLLFPSLEKHIEARDCWVFYVPLLYIMY